MKSKFVIGFAACLAISVPAIAKQEPYGLRGAKLGMPLEDFLSLKIPVDANSIIKIEPEAVCLPSAGLIKCQWHAASSRVSKKLLKHQMFTAIGDGGGYVDFWFLKIGQQKLLYRINVRSNMQYLDGILSPLETVYGKPVINNSEAQNGFGATFAKSTYLWTNNVSTISLETRCQKIKFLCLEFKHTDLADRILKKEREYKGDPTKRL